MTEPAGTKDRILARFGIALDTKDAARMAEQGEAGALLVATLSAAERQGAGPALFFATGLDAHAASMRLSLEQDRHD